MKRRYNDNPHGGEYKRRKGNFGNAQFGGKGKRALVVYRRRKRVVVDGARFDLV